MNMKKARLPFLVCVYYSSSIIYIQDTDTYAKAPHQTSEIEAITHNESVDRIII
jgi:hypothetical protein